MHRHQDIEQRKPKNFSNYSSPKSKVQFLIESMQSSFALLVRNEYDYICVLPLSLVVFILVWLLQSFWQTHTYTANHIAANIQALGVISNDSQTKPKIEICVHVCCAIQNMIPEEFPVSRHTWKATIHTEWYENSTFKKCSHTQNFKFLNNWVCFKQEIAICKKEVLDGNEMHANAKKEARKTFQLHGFFCCCLLKCNSVANRQWP